MFISRSVSLSLVASDFSFLRMNAFFRRREEGQSDRNASARLLSSFLFIHFRLPYFYHFVDLNCPNGWTGGDGRDGRERVSVSLFCLRYFS